MTDSQVLRRLLVVGVVGSLLLVCAGTASAQVISATATATPRLAAFPTTRSAEFRLELVTGANPASVSVDFLKPRYGHGRAGWTLGIDDPRLEGPGRLRPLPPIHMDFAGLACIRGFTSGHTATRVEQIPANSTTTLVVPASLSSTSPPWADTSYKLGFKITQAGRKPIRVSATRPGRRGLEGVRIGIHIRARWVYAPGREASPNTAISVFGGTRPRLPHHPIAVSLHQMRFDTPRDRTILRRLRTDRHGNYRTVFTPQVEGQYIVAAALRPRAREQFVRDVSCASEFRVQELDRPSGSADGSLIEQ